MKDYWHTFFWKEWHDRLFKKYITFEDVVGKGKPKQYDKVYTFDEETGEPIEHNIKPVEYQKVVFIEKNRNNYMLPVIFEKDFPLKPKKWLECLEKKSNKEVFNFVTEVISVNIPADSLGKSFKEFIDNYNPIEHTNPLHNTLMKLLAFSTTHKGVGVCICSEPEFGKGVNFNLLKYQGQKTTFLTDPTKAFFYQSVLNNKVLVFDEMPTCKAETIKEIETTVLKLKDNSPELPKQALKWGSQPAEADLRSISTIFTYNRPNDLKAKEKQFESVWNNPGAIFSRLPRFLMEGRVQQSMTNPSNVQISEAVEKGADFFKQISMQTEYWSKNIHTQLKGWDRTELNLRGRHYTNAESWIDCIEAYCETEEEFNTFLKELNKMKNKYKQMLKGNEYDYDKDQGFETGTLV